MEHERRRDDARISKLVVDVKVLERKIDENSELTKEIRDLVTSFRVVASVAKWITTILLALAAMWHGWHFMKGH